MQFDVPPVPPLPPTGKAPKRDPSSLAIGAGACIGIPFIGGIVLMMIGGAVGNVEPTPESKPSPTVATLESRFPLEDDRQAIWKEMDAAGKKASNKADQRYPIPEGFNVDPGSASYQRKAQKHNDYEEELTEQAQSAFRQHYKLSKAEFAQLESESVRREWWGSHRPGE